MALPKSLDISPTKGRLDFQPNDMGGPHIAHPPPKSTPQVSFISPTPEPQVVAFSGLQNSRQCRPEKQHH